ncbi:hypothetical protein ACTHO0_00155 [Cytobacillus praedii]|uniref:hypothetical protein n=1 Tax=Cytobacillus praedii TaxID=1742358 RepID=UPI000ADB8C65|nr:hypothetical protein [Cytobacillus praedii]MED3575108.1 hypothetical protein [Cytobacillus praedii]
MVKKNNNFVNEDRLKAFGFTKAKNTIKNDNDNENINSIGNSGNSDVDMNLEVHIDNSAIGFAILCSLLATGQMNESEFEKSVKKLEELTNKRMSNFSGYDINNPSNVRLYKTKR